MTGPSDGEYRRWHPAGPAWGTSSSEDEDWQPVVADQPAGDTPAVGGGQGADDPFLRHYQLQSSPMTSSSGSDLQSARQMAMSGSGSTIVRRSAGQPLAAAYEARNVFITNLPEVLLFHMHQRTAAKVYQEWQECEVIIGKRPRRGRHA